MSDDDSEMPERLKSAKRTLDEVELDEVDPVDGPDSKESDSNETSGGDEPASERMESTGSPKTDDGIYEESVDSPQLDPAASRGERAAEAGKAITTDQTKKVTQYALPETWDDLRTFIDLEVQRELYERGVQGATDNEIFDAAMVVIQRYPEEVAEQVIERRLERAD